MITAMTDPETGEERYDLSRLTTSLTQVRQNLMVARQRRFQAMQQYLAPYNLRGDVVAGRKVLGECRVFKLTTAVQTYQRLLAARRPNVFTRTWDESGTPAALMLEKATNQQFEAMKIKATFKSAVLEALFAAGVTKTGVDQNQQIYCEVVDFDDVVFDLAANNVQKLRYIGNFYRLPVSEAEPLLGGRKVPVENQVHIFENWDVKSLSTTVSPDTLEPEVELLDVFLLAERKMVTFLAQGRTAFDVLHIVDYVGPESGPYDFLQFGEMPKSCIPMGPATVWREISEAIDTITSKLFRQAKRQKSIIAGNGEQKDLERLAKSGDADWLQTVGKVNESVAEVNFGGPSQQNFAFNITAMEWFNTISGNLNVLAGLWVEAQTAHQEELLNQNAGGIVDEMRDRVHEFAACISYKIGWYLWHSDMVIPIEIASPSGMVTVTHLWTPQQRQQMWDQFRFEIEPYSMMPQTPTSVRDAINKTVAEVIAPLAGQLQAQGYIIDAAEIVKLNARLSNLPEINRILKMNPIAAMAISGGGGEAAGPQTAPPPREYIRTSRSQPTTAAKNAAIRAQAFGQNQQPKQQAQAAAGGA